MSIPYRFMPWVRRGLARSHTAVDNNASLRARPAGRVGLTLQAKQDGNPAAAVSGNIDLNLYGPGDVIGIDPRLVVRTDPKPNVTNFEPNYLAIIDFDPPDFPWLLTPAKANGENLRPWLVLVVLDLTRNKIALPRLQAGRPLPSISLSAAQAATELPDLNDSWLWAHTQAVPEAVPGDKTTLAKELKANPVRNISRLVCPRRLSSNTNYLACVVPAFDVGRERGLGQPVAADAMLGPAWNPAAHTDIELPVYTHWEFSTGEVGDIEALARRLKTPDKYKNDTDLLAQLDHIGELPVAVDADHLLFDGANPGQTLFEGALVSLDFEPNPVDPAFQQAKQMFATKLEAMLNSGQTLASTGEKKAAIVPTLSPPIYGEHPTKRHQVIKQKVDEHWLDQLNLQPRYRLAAGWGAELVRTHQDEFMQAAWEQMGEVLAMERALSMSRLSRDVLKVIETRHLNKLPQDRLLAVLAPARAHIKLAPEESLFGRIGRATLPDELFDGAMRRLTSARRPTLKMAQWRERDLNMQSIPLQMGALVTTFANAAQHLDAVDPNRFVPDGILGSRSFDNIPLPDDPAMLVDLQPYTGLAGSMTSGEIRSIQEANRKARDQAARTKRTLPKMGDVWHTGIVTETHELRWMELQRAAGQSLTQSNLAQLVKQASQRGAEGVLLTVQQDGRVNAQSLKIDGRNGNLKTFGVVRGGGRLGRAARIAPGSIGAVPIRALHEYGNSAVFTSLPPGTLGQAAAAVDIRLDSPGKFTPVADVVADQAIPTITMPPAIKERAVLQRYSEAFKEYQQLWRDPLQDARVAIQPVDFAMQQSVNQARARINPDQTVPTRLASMLALGEQSVAWDQAKGFTSPHIATRLDLAFMENLRYVIPRNFDRVMAYPHLVFPLAKKLEILAPDVFLPGVGVLPDDFIMAVKTNPRFVEALMLGANYEMGRELLWQGFPTDQRGTPFQHFWQRLDGGIDIKPIHEWLAKPLGQQPDSGEMLVLLIRGQLLERFPNLSIYAYPKVANESRPGGSSPPVAKGTIDLKEMAPDKILRPVLRGHLGKDITYVGFDSNAIQATEASMKNFFFILEEQMTEPRFGFDEPGGGGVQDQRSWLDVDWDEVGVKRGEYFAGSNLKQAPPVTTGKPDVQQAWNTPHAALAAQALLQRPFRGYYLGTKLVPPKK